MAQLPAAAAAPGVDLPGNGDDGCVAPTAGGLRDRLVRQRRHPHRQWPVIALSHAELAELQNAMAGQSGHHTIMMSNAVRAARR